MGVLGRLESATIQTRGALGFAVRLLIGLSAAALLLASAVGHAAPEDDFQAGRKAYEAGDVTGALKVLRAPADAGHPGAQRLLAFVLDSAGLYEESVAYYRKALAQGDLDAEYGLALALLSGNGVPKDAAQARRHIESAAGRGHALSIRWLAESALRAGPRGAPADTPSTLSPADLDWVRKAAALDHLPSLDHLSRAYRAGTYGAPDLAQAKEYEARAEKLRFPNGRPRTRRAASAG